MIAFVFSGGGSRGAMEAGGVRALYEAGIRPDMVVGSSAGAMNAAFLATDPSPAGADRLCEIWRSVGNKDIVPGSLVAKAMRLARGKPSIFAQEPLKAFVQRHIPPLYLPQDSQLVRTLCRVYGELTGADADPVAIGGGTYARTMPNIVAFGGAFPGDPETAHQAGEYLTIDQLLATAAIYRQALLALASGNSGVSG